MNYPIRYTDPSGFYTFEQAEDPTRSTFHTHPFVSSDTYFLSPIEAQNIYGVSTPMRVSMASVIDPTGAGLDLILLYIGAVVPVSMSRPPSWFMGGPQVQRIHGGNACDILGNQEQGASRSFGPPVPVATPAWGPVNPLGKGSTGRTVPRNLQEQLAMEAVMSNPRGVDLPTKMSDPRWLAADGWVKRAQHVNGIEIHYLYNKITGEYDDFKFKDY